MDLVACDVRLRVTLGLHVWRCPGRPPAPAELAARPSRLFRRSRPYAGVADDGIERKLLGRVGLCARMSRVEKPLASKESGRVCSNTS
jgi:hypothetical protein